MTTITPTGTAPDINAERPGDQEELLESQEKTKTLPIIEVFGPTIQGEGPLAGSKTMFVRFGGCDYRCRMCDSLHAVIPKAVKKHARRLTEKELVDELVAKRGSSGTMWVTLSGGNPAMWDLDKLCDLLHAHGFAIAVETQGSLWKDWFLKCQMVVISPKSPGMGEKCDVEKLTHILLRFKMASFVNVALKIVIFSQLDIDFAVQLHDEINQHVHPGLIFLSLGNRNPPVLDENNNLVSTISSDEHKLALLEDYRLLAEDILNDYRVIHWRFLPQLHVLMYSNQAEK